MRYQITKEEALMGGWWFTLTDTKTGKVMIEALGKNPIRVPDHVTRLQARLNTKEVLG